MLHVWHHPHKPHDICVCYVVAMIIKVKQGLKCLPKGLKVLVFDEETEELTVCPFTLVRACVCVNARLIIFFS